MRAENTKTQKKNSLTEIMDCFDANNPNPENSFEILKERKLMLDTLFKWRTRYIKREMKNAFKNFKIDETDLPVHVYEKNWGPNEIDDALYEKNYALIPSIPEDEDGTESENPFEFDHMHTKYGCFFLFRGTGLYFCPAKLEDGLYRIYLAQLSQNLHLEIVKTFIYLPNIDAWMSEHFFVKNVHLQSSWYTFTKRFMRIFMEAAKETHSGIKSFAYKFSVRRAYNSEKFAYIREEYENLLNTTSR